MLMTTLTPRTPQASTQTAVNVPGATSVNVATNTPSKPVTTGSTAAKPTSGGASVNVAAPGTRVSVAPNGSAAVAAPGTRVAVAPNGNTAVTAPGTRVAVAPGAFTNVLTPGAAVQVANGPGGQPQVGVQTIAGVDVSTGRAGTIVTGIPFVGSVVVPAMARGGAGRKLLRAL